MASSSAKKIFLASNSQGTSVGISPELSYPCVLQDLLGPEYAVHRILISGWTLRDFADNLTDNVYSLRPDFVVMNFGIIEGAQRILSNWEKRFLSLIPGGARVTGFLHRNRASVLELRHFFGLQARQVSLADYSVAVRDVAGAFGRLDIPYLFLRTPLFPDGGNSLKHPYINHDISIYNAVVNEYESICLDESAEGWEMSDYQYGSVHFSAAGHRKIAKLLSQSILDHLKHGCCG